jgi:hypothetical protein
MLAKNCHSTLAIWVYISVIQVTTTYGSALTAGYFEKRNAARRQVTKRSCPRRSVPR